MQLVRLPVSVRRAHRCVVSRVQAHDPKCCNPPGKPYRNAAFPSYRAKQTQIPVATSTGLRPLHSGERLPKPPPPTSGSWCARLDLTARSSHPIACQPQRPKGMLARGLRDASQPWHRPYRSILRGFSPNGPDISWAIYTTGEDQATAEWSKRKRDAIAARSYRAVALVGELSSKGVRSGIDGKTVDRPLLRKNARLTLVIVVWTACTKR